MKRSPLHSPVGCCIQVMLLWVSGEVYKHLQCATAEMTLLLPRTDGIYTGQRLFLLFIQVVFNL